jgi:hypothetical protein
MTLIGTYHTSDYASGVSVGKINNYTYAFIADGANGLDIVNVNSPVIPQFTSNYNTSGTALTTNFARINNIPFVFVADGNQGFDIIDVSTPAQPMLDTILTVQEERVLSSFIDTVTRVAYIGTFNGNIYIYNLANLPGSISQLSVYITNGDHIMGIQVLNGVAFIAEATTGLEIINVSNPTAPTYMSSYDTQGYANDELVTLNRAYIADGSDGIIVIDVTNPFEPKLSGIAQTEGASYFGFSLSGLVLYSASAQFGVEAFSISTPNSPVQAGYYKTSNTVTNVFYYQGYLYVANSYNGLLIMTFQ